MLNEVLTPEQIYDYMHEEHTPYSSMSKEEGKAHICELIERWAEFSKNNVITVAGFDIEKPQGKVIRKSTV